MSQFSVGKIDELNSCVNRVFSHDEKYIIDVPIQSFSCKTGDTLSIKCLDKPVKTCAFIMNGHVYRSANDSTCISCGGLLVHIPSSMSVGTNVYINISKCKKTVADMRKEEDLKPRTRQRRNL